MPLDDTTAKKTDRVPVLRVPNGVLYSDGTIRIDEVRASHPHIFTPFAGVGRGDEEEELDEEGKPKKPSYSITLLLPKKTHVAVKDLCKRRIAELLAEKKLKAIAADKKFLRDGDLAAKPEMEGMFTVSARETRPPLAKAPDRTTIRKGDRVLIGNRRVLADDLFYGGCYVSAIIRPWFQDHKRYGKRVNAGLTAVQFVRHGEPFGQKRITEDELDESFESIGDDDAGFGDDGGEEDNGGL